MFPKKKIKCGHKYSLYQPLENGAQGAFPKTPGGHNTTY